MCWTHLSETRPKARKPYRCELCDLPIEIGTVHVKRVGISEGYMVSFRMHVACEAVTHNWTENDWECYEPEDVLEELKRAVGA